MVVAVVVMTIILTFFLLSFSHKRTTWIGTKRHQRRSREIRQGERAGPAGWIRCSSCESGWSLFVILCVSGLSGGRGRLRRRQHVNLALNLHRLVSTSADSNTPPLFFLCFIVPELSCWLFAFGLSFSFENKKLNKRLFFSSLNLKQASNYALNQLINTLAHGCSSDVIENKNEMRIYWTHGTFSRIFSELSNLFSLFSQTFKDPGF